MELELLRSPELLPCCEWDNSKTVELLKRLKLHLKTTKIFVLTLHFHLDVTSVGRTRIPLTATILILLWRASNYARKPCLS